MSVERIHIKELGVRARLRLELVDPRWPAILIACAIAAFAGAFGIGRATRSGVASSLPNRHYQLSAQAALVGVPDGLIATPTIPRALASKGTEGIEATNPAPAITVSVSEPVVPPPTAVVGRPSSPPAAVVSRPSSPSASPPPVPVQAHVPAPAATQPSGASSAGPGGSFDSSG